MIEVHLFHGFLGETKDWDEVVNNLESQSLENIKIINHSLLDEFDECPEISNWLKNTCENLNKSTNPKLLVGYSMGGRLAMQLRPEGKVYWLVYGAHPGLIDESQKKKREDWTKYWMQLAQDKNSTDWIEEWNSQEIFKNDRTRPHRKLTQVEMESWISLMKTTALENQPNHQCFISENSHRIWWGCGTDDQKYMEIGKSLSALQFNFNWFKVSDSGHGVIFDNPKAVVTQILEVIKNVE